MLESWWRVKCREVTYDEGTVGSRLGPAQITSSVTLGELASLDLKSLTGKQGGLAEIRDPHLASLIPQLAVKSDLSKTSEAAAPGQAALGPVGACLESRFPSTAFSEIPSCLALSAHLPSEFIGQVPSTNPCLSHFNLTITCTYSLTRIYFVLRECFTDSHNYAQNRTTVNNDMLSVCFPFYRSRP